MSQGRADTVEEAAPGLARHLRANDLPAIIGGFGILVYGVVYVACVHFYSLFGVSPADVGLNYGRLLAESAGLVALWSIPAAAAAWLWNATERRALLKKAGAKSILQRVRMSMWFAPGAVFAFVALVLVILASGDRADVKRGNLPSASLGLFPRPWRADLVSLRWLTNSPVREVPSGCLIYLGQADGTLILYAFKRDQTLRVPASNVVMQSRGYSRSCRAETVVNRDAALPQRVRVTGARR